MNVKKTKPMYVFTMKREGKVYRYMARVTINHSKKYLGCFQTQAEAVAAVKKFFDNHSNHGRK
jgi:hypothetical protein